MQDHSIYTPESLRGEYLRKVAPKRTSRSGPLLVEERPRVITLNMRAAAACASTSSSRAPFPSAWSATVSMGVRSSVSRPVKRNNLSPRISSRARRSPPCAR